MNNKHFYYLLTILVLGNINVFAQAGKLDSTFGVNGIVKWLRGGGEIALQSNGNIILGADYQDSVTSDDLFGLSRYDTSGVLDTTFGVNGKIANEIGGCCDDAANEVIQSNGKIVLGGYCVDNFGSGDYALVRYTANGKLDSTFNGNGVVLTSFDTMGYANYGFNAAIQSDGKIVQVGEAIDSSGEYFGIVRYDSTGTIDNTFGVNGKVLTAIDTFPEALASSIVIQPNGKIIAAGYGANGPAISCFALVRYNTDGSLDDNFGTNGIVTTFFATRSLGNSYDDDEESDLKLQPDGKIVVVGQSLLSTDTLNIYNRAIAFARYDTSGSLDSSFGNGGKLRIRIPNYVDYGGSSVAIEPDGKIMIGGFVADTSTYAAETFALFRYTTNGLIDSTFGINGIDTIYIAPFSGAGNIIFLSNGKFLVGGGVSSSSPEYFYGIITRFISGLNTGILIFSIKQNPVLIYPNPIKSQATLQYTLTQNENISIALYDMQGKLVQTFISNQTQTQGEYKQLLKFNSTLSSGNYLLSISNGEANQGIKISLAR